MSVSGSLDILGLFHSLPASLIFLFNLILFFKTPRKATVPPSASIVNSFDLIALSRKLSNCCLSKISTVLFSTLISVFPLRWYSGRSTRMYGFEGVEVLVKRLRVIGFRSTVIPAGRERDEPNDKVILSGFGFMR